MINNIRIHRNGNCGPGSLGGFFTMKGRDAIYGLSNNHVIANLNNCAVGDVISDFSDDRPIAKLSHWVPLSEHHKAVNQVDMALCKLNADIEPEWELDDDQLSKPNGFIEPRQDGNVYMKLGDGSTRTGRITENYINRVVSFDMCGGNTYHFTNLIEIAPTNGSVFSRPGDSGSIIFSSSDFIVGIILGASNDSRKSFAVPFVGGILRWLPLDIWAP